MNLLPPAERAARYRELADMHLSLGQQAKIAEARASHLELAALWTRLAATAERQAAASPPLGAMADEDLARLTSNA